MNVPSSESTAEVSLTSAEVARWEDEAARLLGEAERLKAEALSYLDRAHRARELFALMRGDAPPPVPPALVPAPAVSAGNDGVRDKRKGPRPPRAGSWREALKGWIYASEVPLSPADLREIIAKSPKAAEFNKSDKGFYHALTRLQKSGDIIRHAGRYYSPKVFSEMADQAPPEVVSYAAPNVIIHSPMGEAILDIVSANPGITSAKIIETLKGDLEFRATLTPHTTGAYNVMSRLAKRGQIVREGSGCFPGPTMSPRDPNSKWMRGAKM